MSEAVDEVKQGMVLYTDGGARNPFTVLPNPGYGGYGIHGYLYNTAKPKKGIGVPGTVPTADGYRSKAELEEDEIPEVLDGEITLAEFKKQQNASLNYGAVTPVHYIDGYGAFGQQMVTNNLCELTGALRGMQHAADFNIQKFHLISDSEYVIKGLNGGVDKWAKANWLQPDGQPRKNADVWKEAITYRDLLTQRGVEFKASWIQSHDGSLGNEEADALATAGVMRSIAGKAEVSIEQTPADGYWSYDPMRHPLLFHRRAYFNTAMNLRNVGEYYMGDHGKDDDAAGIRVSDGCYGVVRIDEPDLAIEQVRDNQIATCSGTDHIAFIRMDNLFRPDTHRQIKAHGIHAMERKNMKLFDLYCLDREPLTKVLNPARLSSRVIEELSALDEKLAWFTAEDARAVRTDLTSILYETVVKTSKNGEATSHKVLKDIYNVGYAALRLDANYKSVEGTIETLPITINLGIDMPDRNALKRLESLDPVVTLITWKDSDYVFRYAVVVKVSNGIGIYSGVYSNMRIIERPAVPA
jgi:ribonuclease HI